MPPSLPNIGEYELLRELGRGANGVVFLARKIGFQKVVALKVLLQQQLDHETLGRFQIEARVASRLVDPGVVTVIDLGRDSQGRPFYVMEFCPGPTLQNRMKTGGPFSVPEALELAAELARILGFAHSKGVIHRDVKPANIILDERTGRPRVTDFGLARDTLLASSLTRSGDVIGTPLYMAPEQLKGVRAIDHRVDVYGLGAILYELLTGLHPHQARSVAELALKVGHDAIRPPSTHRAEIPGQVDAICLKALATDPADRHRDGEELRQELMVARKLIEMRDNHVEPPARSQLIWLVPLVVVSLMTLGGLSALIAAKLSTPPAPVATASPAPSPSLSPSPSPVARPTPQPTPTPTPSPIVPDPERPRDERERGLRIALDMLLDRGAQARFEPPGRASVLIYDLDERRTIYARDPSRPLRANTSVQLLTCSVALEHFADLELTTQLFERGKRSADGVLTGDLGVLGGGDPLLAASDVTHWAEELAKGGLQEVTGDLVLDARFFDSKILNDAWSETMASSYRGARVSGLSCNMACVDVKERGSKREGVVNEETPGEWRFPVDVVPGPVRGSLDATPEGWRVTLDPGWFDRVNPNYAAPVSRPDLFLGAVFKGELRRNRITVEGVREAKPDERLAEWRALDPAKFTHKSPLGLLVKHIGRRSQPFIAESLFRALSARKNATGTWEGSRQILTDYAVNECGADASEVTVADGSGNAATTRLSARALVAILLHALERPWGDQLALSLNRYPVKENDFLMDARQRYRLDWLRIPTIEKACGEKGVVFRVQAQADAREDMVSLVGFVDRRADSQRPARRLVFALLMERGGSNAKGQDLQMDTAGFMDTLDEYIALPR